ncbi:type II toxin-antitoxin system VapC family toxin [Verrucomicrobiota bacterium]
MKTVYIETSVISYFTAQPSAALVTAAHQQITREWWDYHRTRFEQFISPLVLDEASQGDPSAATDRLAAVDGLPVLEVIDSALALVDTLVAEGALPSRAMDDATHVAIATVHNMDYLVTWNCRHLDNAETKPLIRSVCAVHGYNCPEICTPEELMGGTLHER